MKILIAYTHFPCSIGRYWKRGLISAGHQVDSVGYFTGSDIPWPNGPHHLDEYADPPTYPTGYLSNRYNTRDQVWELCENYDLFINVDAAFYWTGPTPIPKVIIATDSHCLDYTAQREDSDLFINMHQAYAKPGDVWIPYAHDPELHFKAAVPRDHYITHIGVEYAARKKLLDMLATRWSVERGIGILFERGSVVYSRGLFALCLPSEQDLATRFFEGLAYGNVVLQKRVPDLQLFDCVEGREYIGFDDESELMEQISQLINDLDRAYAIGNAGREWVKPHTWQARAEALIQTVRERGLVK